MTDDRKIECVAVNPPRRAPGGHFYRYMSYYAGEEHDLEAPRGWGQTTHEAENDLVKKGSTGS